MNKKILNFRSNYHPEILSGNVCYSFLNFASLSQFFVRDSSFKIVYFCDGILLSSLLTLLTKTKINRVSFDYTSIASSVFENSIGSVYFVGAERFELEGFIKKIKQLHPKLAISGAHDGFFKEYEINGIVDDIINSNAKTVIVGLGAGKQESFLEQLHLAGYKGVSFSCGGFIRQESSCSEHYYPSIVDKLNVRAFYRMYKEPHTIKRYFSDYPKNILRVICGYFSGSLTIKVDDLA